MNALTAPRKVLHILDRMQPGGAEVRLLELMGRLCPHEFRVDICALSGLSGSLDPRVRALGGRVVPLRLDLSAPWRFLRLLRQERYDVVHSHVLFASGAILALAARAGVAVRVAHFQATEDGYRPTWRRHVLRRAMRLLIDRYATHIISCGEGSMDAVWRPDWRSYPRCRVVYDAVDPAPFLEPVDRERARAALGIPADARVFLHVGNELPVKNHGRLLAIFAAIRRRRRPGWCWPARGTDDPAGVTARSAQTLGLRDRVLGLGVRHDVPQLLKTSDVLLLPSIHEGLPGVVLEACAAGTPVLASDLPGVREIASRLPLVRYLPLTAADEEWADAALELSSEAPLPRPSDASVDAFRASVFHIDRAVEAHRELWDGIPRRGDLACS